MYEWILIVAVITGPTIGHNWPNNIKIERFETLKKCVDYAPMHMTFAGNPKDQCIKVLKNE